MVSKHRPLTFNWMFSVMLRVFYWIAFLLRPSTDNADRGTFTIGAFGQTLVPELDTWREWPRSEHHSLLHIDGQAQALKASCPTMRQVVDDTSSPERVTIASADLSKSYSVQWHKAFVNPDVVKVNPEYYESEPRNWIRDNASPYEYGWFESGYDSIIELPTKLFGDPDFGFLVRMLRMC